MHSKVRVSNAAELYTWKWYVKSRGLCHAHAQTCRPFLHVRSSCRLPIAVNTRSRFLSAEAEGRLFLSRPRSESPHVSAAQHVALGAARCARLHWLLTFFRVTAALRRDPRAPCCPSPAVTSLTSCPTRSLLFTPSQLHRSPLLLGHPQDVPASAPFPSPFPLPATRFPPHLHGSPPA